GKTRTLTEAWDRSPGSLQWSPDGKSLLATASDAARQKVFRIDAASGEAREVVKDHYNSGVAVLGPKGSSATRIIFALDSLAAPAELHTAQMDGSDAKRLTHFNDE